MSSNESQAAKLPQPLNDTVAEALAVSLRGCEELLPQRMGGEAEPVFQDGQAIAH